MEDLIGKKVTSTVGDICPFYLYEAEQDTYPYAVYFYTPEFHSTKDGVYKIDTDLTLQVYSQDFDEAFALAEAIRTAILAGMNDSQFHARVSSTQKECVEGVWNVEYIYNVIQLS